MPRSSDSVKKSGRSWNCNVYSSRVKSSYFLKKRIITFLRPPARAAEEAGKFSPIRDSLASAYTGDFGNWSPLRKLITGNCSQVGSGRQLSGSTGRQGKPASKKAAMCPLVTCAVDEGIGTLVGSSGLRASAAPPSLASASPALRRRFRSGGGA